MTSGWLPEFSEAWQHGLHPTLAWRVPAYLLLPKGPGPFPGVVDIHARDAFFYSSTIAPSTPARVASSHNYNGWRPGPGDGVQFIWKQARDRRDYRLEDTVGGTWESLAGSPKLPASRRYGLARPCESRETRLTRQSMKSSSS